MEKWKEECQVRHSTETLGLILLCFMLMTRTGRAADSSTWPGQHAFLSRGNHGQWQNLFSIPLLRTISLVITSQSFITWPKQMDLVGISH